MKWEISQNSSFVANFPNSKGPSPSHKVLKKTHCIVFVKILMKQTLCWSFIFFPLIDSSSWCKFQWQFKYQIHYQTSVCLPTAGNTECPLICLCCLRLESEPTSLQSQTFDSDLKISLFCDVFIRRIRLVKLEVLWYQRWRT